MIKKLTLIFIFSFLTSTLSYGAETASPSVIIKDDKIEKIRELKEKIASKVSELRQNKNVATEGEIKSVGDGSFTLITPEGERIAKVSKETKYAWINSSSKKLNINFSNLEKGDSVSIRGSTFDNKEISCSFVIGKTASFSIFGTISEIKPGKKIVLSLQQKKNLLTVVANESTVILMMEPSKKFLDGKFASLKVDDKIFVRGNYKGLDKEEVVAKRILFIKDKSTITPTLTPSFP